MEKLVLEGTLKQRLLITMPPRHAKSFLAMHFPVYSSLKLIRNVLSPCIIRLGEDFGRQVRDLARTFVSQAFRRDVGAAERCWRTNVVRIMLRALRFYYG